MSLYLSVFVSFFIPPSGAIKTFSNSLTVALVMFGAGLMAASGAEMTLFSFIRSLAQLHIVHSRPHLSIPDTHEKLEGNHR